MAQLLLQGSTLSMTNQAADRLIKLDHGDAALLYLYLLRQGNLDGLRWPEERKQTALQILKEQGLAPSTLTLEPSFEPVVPPEAPPPDYSIADITQIMEDPSATFLALTAEAERRLGKKMSSNDLKVLYTLYDYLSLPPEVICLLINWCIEEIERKYGKGRRPTLSQIRREGFIWAKKNIDTIEAAEHHLQTLIRLQSRGTEVLRILDIPPRPLVEQEKNFIASWDAMGFDDEMLRTAYERTIMKKQAMDWRYMNAILRRWHEKGLHTLAAVEANDKLTRTTYSTTPQQNRALPQQSPQAADDMARIRRMMEQFKKMEE